MGFCCFPGPKHGTWGTQFLVISVAADMGRSPKIAVNRYHVPLCSHGLGSRYSAIELLALNSCAYKPARIRVRQRDT